MSTFVYMNIDKYEDALLGLNALFPTCREMIVTIKCDRADFERFKAYLKQSIVEKGLFLIGDEFPENMTFLTCCFPQGNKLILEI